MRTKVEIVDTCARRIKIEISAVELAEKFEQVYADIAKVANIPGYRPGRAPGDLIKTYYGKKAQEEVIKRVIPEYYLKAVEQEKLSPVAPPEIENVQFKSEALCFDARVDVQPKLKLKDYQGIKVNKQKIVIEDKQVDETLSRLRASRAQSTAPDLNDQFAQSLGLPNLEELKQSIRKSLQENAESQAQADLEQQLLNELLKRATLEAPVSLVNAQLPEVLNQLKWQRMMRGEKKEDLEAKHQELVEQARNEAARRVKLAFILAEIARRENIQVSNEDLDKRIESIVQRSGKTKEEVQGYLEKQDLIFGLRQEIIDRKTIDFLIRKAQIET